jgi:hypothetical protein
MPPRGFVIAVIVFWIGTSCLLFERAILPRWQAGAAPEFAIELTDEVGSPQVSWDVYRGKAKVGAGITHIRLRRQPERTFEMSQQFRFDDFKVVAISVKRLDTVYHITREGRLLAIRVSGQANIFGTIEVNADLEADVQDGFLEPKLKLKASGAPIDVVTIDKIEVAEHGNILNPMHLVHRLPRLQEGQRWQVPLFDPLKMFEKVKVLGAPLPFLPSSPTSLDAQVFADTMRWNHEDVACLRVDYRVPGKDELVARTWVRRADGLVLAQDAQQHGQEFSIRRVPELRQFP